MSSIKCFFTSLQEVRNFPDPEINRIAIGTVDGNTVVVGINSYVGMPGILFYPDCVLSEDFKTKQGLTSSSFKSGRVRVARFKGVWSEALFIPMSEDEVFELFGERFALGSPLPEKSDIYSVYLPKVKSINASSNQAGGKFKRGELPTFPQHMDTEQLRSYVKEIERLFKSGWNASISLKLHGTSGRTGHVRVPKDFSTLQKAKAWFINKVLRRSAKEYLEAIENKNYLNCDGPYQIVNGTRRVILSEKEKIADNGFYPISFREKTSYFDINIPKNYNIYYEIVGWECEDKPIMARTPNYTFSYGIPNGDFAIFVYRVTHFGIDLNVFDMGQFCSEVLNLGTVPLLTPVVNKNNTSWEDLLKQINETYEYSRGIKRVPVVYSDTSFGVLEYDHINEGIVLRMDPPESEKNYTKAKFFKMKLPEFYEEEGLIKSAENARVSLEQE
jgi:hypothetical protein